MYRILNFTILFISFSDFLANVKDNKILGGIILCLEIH